MPSRRRMRSSRPKAPFRQSRLGTRCSSRLRDPTIRHLPHPEAGATFTGEIRDRKLSAEADCVRVQALGRSRGGFSTRIHLNAGCDGPAARLRSDRRSGRRTHSPGTLMLRAGQTKQFCRGAPCPLKLLSLRWNQNSEFPRTPAPFIWIHLNENGSQRGESGIPPRHSARVLSSFPRVLGRTTARYGHQEEQPRERR